MILGSFKPSDPRRNSRLAASAVTVAAVVFVAIGIGVELVFLPRTHASSTPTTTTTLYNCTGCGTPSSTVKAAVTRWLADFNDRNVTGIGNFYGQDALVTVMGGREAGAGLDGAYKGLENIEILYGSSIGETADLTASIANYNEYDVNPHNANVSLTLDMVGDSGPESTGFPPFYSLTAPFGVGNLNITVDANQQWNYVSGQWQIAKETWNYVSFTEQFPVTGTAW